jgi:hypothetical protein
MQRERKRLKIESIFDRIPNEIILYIFTHADIGDWKSIVRVCKHWNVLFNNNWKICAEKQFNYKIQHELDDTLKDALMQLNSESLLIRADLFKIIVEQVGIHRKVLLTFYPKSGHIRVIVNTFNVCILTALIPSYYRYLYCNINREDLDDFASFINGSKYVKISKCRLHVKETIFFGGLCEGAESRNIGRYGKPLQLSTDQKADIEKDGYFLYNKVCTK